MLIEDLLKDDESNIKVLPSLLSADFLNLKEQLDDLRKNDIKILHFDVMDGHFVRNISFGESIFPLIHNQGFIEDVHLMVTNPLEHAMNFASLGCKMVSCHIECFKDFDEVDTYVQNMWLEVPELALGIAIKPSTPLDLLLECIHLFDYVLIMTVEPGKGGQKFNFDMVDRIKTVSEFIKEQKLECLIEVDGGINDQTAKVCKKNGARLLVSGSYLLDDTSDLEDKIALLQKE